MIGTAVTVAAAVVSVSVTQVHDSFRFRAGVGVAGVAVVDDGVAGAGVVGAGVAGAGVAVVVTDVAGADAGVAVVDEVANPDADSR